MNFYAAVKFALHEYSVRKVLMLQQVVPQAALKALQL